MADKVHKSLRLDVDLVERVEALKNPGESTAAAMCRFMALGCDTVEHANEHEEKAEKHNEHTEKLISLLEADNARLVALNEKYLGIIADKDEQIKQALDRAYDTVEQAHILVGLAQDTKAITEGGDLLDVQPTQGRRGFLEWVKGLCD